MVPQVAGPHPGMAAQDRAWHRIEPDRSHRSMHVCSCGTSVYAGRRSKDVALMNSMNSMKQPTKRGHYENIIGYYIVAQ